MPVLSGSSVNKNGQSVFTYDYIGVEGANDIVATIIANADSKPTINGELNGKQGQVGPANVEKHLSRGGRVIVMATCAGVRIKVSIAEDKARAIPENGERDAADMLLDVVTFEDEMNEDFEDDLLPVPSPYPIDEPEPYGEPMYEYDEYNEYDDDDIYMDDQSFQQQDGMVGQQSMYQPVPVPQDMPPSMMPEEPVSVIKWIALMIVSVIPIVGLVVLLVIALKGKNRTQKNWAIAELVLTVLCTVLVALTCMFAGAGIISMIKGTQGASGGEATTSAIQNDINIVDENGNAAADAGNYNAPAQATNSNAVPSDQGQQQSSAQQQQQQPVQQVQAPPISVKAPEAQQAPVVTLGDKNYFIATYIISNASGNPINLGTDLVYEATFNGIPLPYEVPNGYQIDEVALGTPLKSGDTAQFQRAWIFDGNGGVMVITAKNAATGEELLNATYSIPAPNAA